MKISGRTKVCALIGDPVEHSLSPIIQNAAFRSLDLDYVYVVFNVKSGDLREAVYGVKALGICGLNVTMPHKTAIIPYLDELDETARKTGSVNTVFNNNGRLVGYTTDGVGALNALKHAGVDPSDKRIVILGAGGASRSISFTLAEHASELVILNRTFSKAKALKDAIRKALGDRAKVRASPLTDEKLSVELADADILINATSVGMKPNENETPVKQIYLREDLVVFDLIYEPLETRLLREAKSIGAKVVDGLSMLVHQGAASFEIWTGIKAPVDVMMKAALKAIQRREGGV